MFRQNQAWIDMDLEDRVDALEKIFSGDLAFAVSKATQTRTAASLNVATPPTDTIVITLVDGDGNVYDKYNGPIKLAIADTSTNGTAAITPTATTPDMVNGSYTVTVSYTYASTGWAAEDTVTLTVSDPDTDGIAGWSVASKTFVMTVS